MPTITRQTVTVGGALGPFTTKELRILVQTLTKFVEENDTEKADKELKDQVSVARQGIQYFKEVADEASGVRGT